MNKKHLDKKNSRCSRGYCGYFFTKNGERLYLRSLKEYIVASWLSSLETENIILKGEWYISNYRPDFRIEIDNKVRLVVEVKDNKKDAEEYIKKYKQIINDFGYRYIVIYKKKTFLYLIEKLNIDLDQWRNQCEYDYSGENNPRFGVKASEKTKFLIGKKTKERCEDINYRKKLGKAISNGMSSESKRKIGENTKKFAKIRAEKRNEEDPIIDVPCLRCKTYKQIRKSKIKQLEFCSPGCAVAYYASIGKSRKFTSDERKSRMRLALIRYGKLLYEKYGNINEEIIKQGRKEGIISKNSQISLFSIEKYFSNLELFMESLCQN